MEFSDRRKHCHPLQVRLWLLIFITISTSSAAVPRRGWIPEHETPSPNKAGRNLMGWKPYFYSQTVDHFNYRRESYRHFQQRYVINDKYWRGPKNNSPIFVFFGAEEPIDDDLATAGFLKENAPFFNALIVFIEHRYYGMSNPDGSMLNSTVDPEIRGYFDSAQALADYAEVILHLKKQFNAHYCPVIVFGGSYGGMLASWFRLKYPHIALGALASSAPILMHFKSPETYYNWVSKDYNDTSKKCYSTIKQSWDEIDNLASKPNGLQILGEKFKICGNLTSAEQLKSYLRFSIYSTAAQYDLPPIYPVSKICKAIDELPKGTNILDKVASGLAALNGTGLASMNESRTCFIPTTKGVALTDTILGWNWQNCSEIVNVFSMSGKDSMFQEHAALNLTEFIQECNRTYGVPTRPFWLDIYYGGQDAIPWICLSRATVTRNG